MAMVSNGSATVDSANLTLDVLVAALDKLKDLKPVGPGAYKMNFRTQAKLREMIALETKPTDLLFYTMIGVEIYTDDRLPDDVCIPTLTAAEKRKASYPETSQLPRTFSSDKSFREQVDAYKVDIRAGKLVGGWRASGRTTALLEVIHEDHAGMVFLGLPDHHMADWTRKQYQTLFPNDHQPHVFVLNRHYSLRGTDPQTPVFVDIYYKVDYDDQIQFESEMARMGRKFAGAF